MPDGPGGFAQNFTCSALLRIPLRRRGIRVRGCHPLRRSFPGSFRSPLPSDFAVLQPRGGVATPAVWALPRSLATTGGIIDLFSLPRGTKMFQFPRLAPCVAWCAPFRRAGCPIRKSRDQWPFAPTPCLSQLITSFFASVSLGIRHTPFPTSLVVHTFSCCRITSNRP